MARVYPIRYQDMEEITLDEYGRELLDPTPHAVAFPMPASDQSPDFKELLDLMRATFLSGELPEETQEEMDNFDIDDPDFPDSSWKSEYEYEQNFDHLGGIEEPPLSDPSPDPVVKEPEV